LLAGDGHYEPNAGHIEGQLLCSPDVNQPLHRVTYCDV